jgi:hypothetical protein
VERNQRSIDGPSFRPHAFQVRAACAYVLFGAIPLGLSFFFLWTPVQQPPWMLAAYFLVLLFIFDTLYSLTHRL